MSELIDRIFDAEELRRAVESRWCPECACIVPNQLCNQSHILSHKFGLWTRCPEMRPPGLEHSAVSIDDDGAEYTPFHQWRGMFGAITNDEAAALIRDGITQEARRRGRLVQLSGQTALIGPGFYGHGPNDTLRLVAAFHKYLDAQRKQP